MLSSRHLLVTVFAVVGVLALGATPAGAATGYEMFGYGELVATEGPGLTACPPRCDQNTTTVYTFQTLPITGVGVLLDEPVASNYDCPSSVTVVGNTSNFTIDWDFTCVKTIGLVGPDVITGSFASVAPGAPLFAGFFQVGARTVESTCTGGFAPTGYDFANDTITRAIFAGECTSAAA